ncbi:DNA-directed RNA polymerase subunit delta [Pseudalkalibacillus berkeleyi]|uniref:Probable DNA-directed RNA polymerase subunit delta n=1 Tax=Pseudalkalibacillus berkeleyi TaxID=1069813 RepID=A0ABS9H1S5_9BACL|nr:DNA-directed RNA polymerase subunit delta [Pseudalkalibacillus berkeleyi]MCF6138934.1 DNA-directed RNA polymerase subunit delta [Pseudalkalibacillus berkeleyi]
MLDTYSKEELKEVSMIEIAFHILQENKKPTPFTELVSQVAKMRNMSSAEQKQRIAQFYTDINVDGRFVCMGDNQWGLKVWYPVETSDEELASTIKPKKKKSKKKSKAKLAEEEEDFEDFEEDLEDDFDDLEDDFDDEELEDDFDDDDEDDDLDDDDTDIPDDEDVDDEEEEK